MKINNMTAAKQVGRMVMALAVTMGSLFADEPVHPSTGAGQEYTGVELKEVPSSASAALPDKSSITTHITVNTKQVIGPLSKNLFGLNFDRLGLETALVEATNGAIDPAGAALFKGIPMPLNRVAGEDAMAFRWKEAIGPMPERAPQQLTPWASPKKITVGPIEFAQWLKEIDPKAGTAWVFNIFQNTPQDHADLVEFLTGEPGKPHGKFDWAKRRVELGLKDPVNVEIWEIGNEVDWNSKEHWTIAHYIDECRKTIKAVREVNPKAKIAVHALTAPWAPNHEEFSSVSWAGWHRALLKALGPDIDYIVFHPYYDGHPTSKIESYLDVIRDDIKQITGENRIHVYLSEHARWPEMPKSGEWKQNWYLTHCLDGCLDTAQFLVRCMTRPEITAASYHCAISSGPWGVVYRDDTSGKLYSTGIAELFRLFALIPDGEVVATTVDGPQTDVTMPDINFVATAVRSAKTLSLVVVNRGPAREVSFNLGGDYRLTAGWVFSGPEGSAVNTYANHPLAIQPILIGKEEERMSARLIPALSMSVFELQTDQQPPFQQSTHKP